MRSFVMLFIVGFAVGTAAAWGLAKSRPQPEGQPTVEAPSSAHPTEPAGALGASAGGDASPVATGSASPSSALPGRPLFDLLPARSGGGVPSETARDERWAGAMEGAVGDRAKGKLLEFIPGATWDGFSCMTQTCTMYFRVPADDTRLAELVTNFVAGYGTRFRYGTQDAEDGQVEFSVTAEYRDRATDERLSPEAFLALQAHQPREALEWEARIKASLRGQR